MTHTQTHTKGHRKKQNTHRWWSNLANAVLLGDRSDLGDIRQWIFELICGGDKDRTLRGHFEAKLLVLFHGYLRSIHASLHHELVCRERLILHGRLTFGNFGFTCHFVFLHAKKKIFFLSSLLRQSFTSLTACGSLFCTQSSLCTRFCRARDAIWDFCSIFLWLLNHKFAFRPLD